MPIVNKQHEWTRGAIDRRGAERPSVRALGVNEVIQRRARQRRWNRKRQARPVGDGPDTMLSLIAIGPVDEHAWCLGEAAVGRGADQHRRLGDAGVRERRRVEDRSGIARAALEVRTNLQRSVPELDAAMRAGGHERIGQPIVADDPRRQRQRYRGGEDDCAHQVRARSSDQDIAGREYRGQHDHVRPKLRHQAGEESAERDVDDAAIAHTPREDDHRTQKQHRAHRIGRLRGRMHGVEGKNAEDQRREGRRAAADQWLRQVIEQERRGAVDDDLCQHRRTSALASSWY